MKIEIRNAIFTLEWQNKMNRTETAPVEGGDFEVTNIEVIGPASKDDLIEWEEMAFAEAYDQLESQQ